MASMIRNLEKWRSIEDREENTVIFGDLIIFYERDSEEVEGGALEARETQLQCIVKSIDLRFCPPCN